MGKINYRRVCIGGLIAAVVFIVTELFIEGLAGILWGISETDLLREYFPHALQGVLRFQILNLLYLLLICFMLIWLYAALRPRFGAGPKTALICAFLFWLIELPVAVLAGASIYQETNSKV